MYVFIMLWLISYKTSMYSISWLSQPIASEMTEHKNSNNLWNSYAKKYHWIYKGKTINEVIEFLVQTECSYWQTNNHAWKWNLYHTYRTEMMRNIDKTYL